jgi:uncharacterized protein YjcR
MERSYSPETMAGVQRHVEGSTLTYLEIAKLTGVSASTISRWKCRHKWQRRPGAFGGRPLPKDQRAAAERAMADGARCAAQHHRMGTLPLTSTSCEPAP